MTTLKLYGAPGSSNTHRVWATLFEKEVIDFEFVTIDLVAKAQYKPEYLEVQPFGKVPALVDGRLTLFESRAIARYVASKYEGQGTPLFGSSASQKALVEQWMEVEGQNFSPHMSSILFERIGKLRQGKQTDEAVVDASVAKLGQVLDVYDAHLANSKYLAGDFFSLADLAHLPGLNYLIFRFHKGDVLNARPHVKAWWENISSRPSWKRVLALVPK